MLILPAIDIYNGKCVRLQQGDFNRQTVYNDSPAAVAESFRKAGLSFLHLVDLEGAQVGRVMNWEALSSICSLDGVRTQIGGGIRTVDDVGKLFGIGATRAILGSLAVDSPHLVREWLLEFGSDRFVIAVDIKDGRVASKGWAEKSGPPEAFLQQMIDIGARRFLCTDVSRDGMLAGPNIYLYRELMSAFPEVELLASGGVTRLDDLRTLREAGCAGAIVGKALYENKITLEELTAFA